MFVDCDGRCGWNDVLYRHGNLWNFFFGGSRSLDVSSMIVD